MTVLLTIPALRAASITPAFTYQGQLQTASGPANGFYDLRFRLFDAATLGAPIGSPVTNSAVVVSNGYFTVALDFGAAFTEARWIEIGVRTNGSLAGFTLLTPRQAVTPTPNAIVASQLSGALSSSQLAGTYASPVTISNAASVFQGTFNGNGAGLVSLNASNLSAGTLADARLGTNVALLNRNNQAFTGVNTFSSNVGIGTNSPSERLHVVAGSGTEVRIQNTGSGTAAMSLVNSNHSYEVRIHTDETFRVRDGTATRLTIATNGNVGIGTTSPADKLHVNGGVTATTFTGNGAGLTGLGDGNLSANVALLNRNNQAFTGNNSFSGYLGIGTATPLAPLHVVGNNPFPHLKIAAAAPAPYGAFLSLDATATTGGKDYLIYSTGGIAGEGQGKLVFQNFTDGVIPLALTPGGNVGIGTTTPETLLQVGSYASSDQYLTVATAGGGWFRSAINLRHFNSGYGWTLMSDERDSSFRLLSHFNDTNGVTRMYVDRFSGRVGIGTTNPLAPLHAIGNGPSLALEGAGHTYIEFYPNGAAAGRKGYIGYPGDGYIDLNIQNANPNGNINLAPNGTGVVRVPVIQITGGADIAEPFEVRSAGNNGPATIEPGMVVSIDPSNPGELRLSTASYDRTVAGIISGAGGVKPGMTLQQSGTLADGKHPVALTGRVWCHVDADSASVEPGDLLTTSDTPGHAMKVVDHGRSQGAIIGKAMTKMEKGRGLVLVLVSLQ